MKLKALWYCTKAKPYLTRTWKNQFELATLKEIVEQDTLNGKIVAVSDFEVEEVKEIYCCGCLIQTKTMCYQELLGRSRLSDEEFDKYNPNYAIHIKNLHIFDKPKELKDLYVKGSYHNAEQMFTDEIQINGEWFHPMTKAPQNMCYVQDIFGNKYVVISVHPEWLAMILNGLKTIELRKKVLKEML